MILAEESLLPENPTMQDKKMGDLPVTVTVHNKYRQNKHPHMLLYY